MFQVNTSRLPFPLSTGIFNYIVFIFRDALDYPYVRPLNLTRVTSFWSYLGAVKRMRGGGGAKIPSPT